MENSLIRITDICTHHHVKVEFIQSLENFGLIHTTLVKRDTYLDITELSKLERYIRLSSDLDINLEGLHAVSILLEQLNKLEDEVTQLKNELDYYKQTFHS